MKKISKAGIYWMILIIIAVGIGGFFYFTTILDDGASPDGIVVEDLGNGEKLVRNVDEGVYIRLPSDWMLKAQMNKESIAVRKLGDGQSREETELIDAIDVTLSVVENEKKLTIYDWKKEHSAYSDAEVENMDSEIINDVVILKTKQEFHYEDDSPWTGLIDINLHYSFVFGSKYYDYNCRYVSVPDNDTTYKFECDNIIISNILEFVQNS